MATARVAKAKASGKKARPALRPPPYGVGERRPVRTGLWATVTLGERDVEIRYEGEPAPALRPALVARDDGSTSLRASYGAAGEGGEGGEGDDLGDGADFDEGEGGADAWARVDVVLDCRGASHEMLAAFESAVDALLETSKAGACDAGGAGGDLRDLTYVGPSRAALVHVLRPVFDHFAFGGHSTLT
jgi:hypothetical protein